jgi:cytochrome c553
MKKLLLASVIALMPVAAFAAENALSWAYPVAPQGLPAPDPNQKFQATGTTTGMQLTAREINNQFGPPDWFPNEHPAMPAMVKNGRAPHVRACMLCHLPTGNGHPESASVGGLSADYITEQMHEFRDGNRMNNRAPVMIEMAKDITESELKEAADYFASIPRDKQKWI